MSNRQTQFEAWLLEQCGASTINLRALAKDASFRRYFALSHDADWLAVDAPPEHEKNHEFLAVAQAFSSMGVRVPEIKAHDLAQGFLLVENLGPDSYLKVLQDSPELADKLYKEAIDTLLQVASAPLGAPEHFDHTYLRAELNNFTEWFLEKYLGFDLSAQDRLMLDQAYNFLIERAQNQKQVCIHRDYHSRNLIVRDKQNPGVIDFQDAMLGPLTYDLVSLLRDAYIAWPREQVESWAHYFYECYRKKHADFIQSWPEFLDDFNLMGVQRNLKAIFIFARKWLRDEDAGYLNDIPRTLDYVISVSDDYDSLKDFNHFLCEQVKPKL